MKEKMIQAKNKLKLYKEKLTSGEDIEDANLNDVVQNLEEK